ncbi:MAG: translocation/assembly module TamB domain-containing protein [Pseudomonadota bacterium]
MRRILIPAVALGVTALAGVAGLAIAQDDEKSRFVRFVERQISTPDRQISLGTIDGALSSDVRISEITIADRQGVWLTIEGAELVWSRFALLRGRLDIDRLRADKIDIARAPLPAENTEPLEGGSEFALPELPVAVEIDELAVPRVDIAANVIGPAASLGVEGRARLSDGSLDAALGIERLDRPGNFAIEASFENESRQLAINVSVEEPADGVIANALQVEGRPPLAFTIAGEGPLGDFTAEIGLVADGAQLLAGTVALDSTADGLTVAGDINGNLAPLVADLYDPFVDGGTTVKFQALRRNDGALDISEGRLLSGVAALDFSVALGADGVPTRLSVNGDLGRADGNPLALPGGGGEATIRSATIDASLGEGDRLFAEIALTNLDTALVRAPAANIRLDGTAQNLGDAQTRAITFQLRGGADNIASDNPGLSDALGARLSLSADGAWRAGAPVEVTGAAIETATVSANFAGTLGDVIRGTYRLAARDLSVFAALAGRPLGGRIDLSAEGALTPAEALFDLTLDGTIENLALGTPADGLFAGTTTLAGRAAREPSGVRFDGFAVENPALSLTANGAATEALADLRAAVRIADLGRLSQDTSGPLSVDLTVAGNPAAPQVDATIESAGITLPGAELENLAARFNGVFTRGEVPFDLDGDLTATARYRGAPVELSTTLASEAAGRRLSDLIVRIVDARAEGDIALVDGLLSGRLGLDVPDLSALAPLIGQEASGAIRGLAAFAPIRGRQTADFDARITDLSLAGTTLGFADIDLAIDNLFGVPAVEGRADIRAARVAGITLRTATLTAARDGETTRTTLDATLADASLSATGALTRTLEGFDVALSAFRLGNDRLAATLSAPATVSVGTEVRIEDLALSVGTGRLAVSGTVGEALDLSASLDRLPLAIANLIKPDLRLGGTVSGNLDARGSLADPVAAADLTLSGITAAEIARAGLSPLDASLRGRFEDGQGTIETLSAAIGGGTVSASGTFGDRFDLLLAIENLPLSLANVAAPDLGLSGTLGGNATVTGTLSDPAANFTLNAQAVSARPLRGANIEPLNATLEGAFANGVLTLRDAGVAIGGGRVAAAGTVGDRLDLTLTLDAVPLAIANGFVPSLGASGTLSGRADVSGAPSRPRATFDVAAGSLSLAATRAAGLSTGSLRASGAYDGRLVRLQTAVLRIGGGELTASGTAGPQLDLAATLRDVPLAIVNAFAPSLGLSGALSGTVRAEGPAARPSATFALTGAGVSAAPLQDAGVGALQVAADGRFSGNAIALSSVRASGAGLAVDASGTLPLSGPGLSLSVSANAPLSLANRFLAGRGARIGGEATLNARITGSLASPQVAGSVSASGITLRDPQTSLFLDRGTLSASLSGDRVVISALNASLGGGSVAVSGTVGLGSGIPADLDVRLTNARYTDGRLIAVTLSGDLTVEGQLAVQPSVRGNIRIERAEITVPESLAGAGALIDVTHIYPPADVLETLRRARIGPFAERTDGRQSSGLLLDVFIDAPARLFIRGRGIDAEFGGAVRITGPVSDIVPVGRFELIRGRLIILGQRITFTDGAVTLLGDLNPTIRLVAETRTGEVTVRVIVSGSARDPDITFESDPELPQDEVLAQLLFGRSLGDLSAFQLAQLAAAAAELAGGSSGPGLLEQIRVVAGLDNLEIVTDDEGNTAAEAGRYIADNVYVGVRAGEEGSGVTVNLDVTRKVKIRAEALTNETSVGIYVEHEY